ncbi:SDR family NAD(P)-dependent oxidoreductase [Chloroflexota bacterium]
MYDLKGKVAMITGTARKRGIGRATALRLAKEGADMVIQGRYRPPELRPEWERREGWKGLDSLVEEIEALGRQALTVTGDISVKKEVEQMVAKALDKFGHIDILVNNASLHSVRDHALIIEMPEEMWNSYLTVNVTGTLLISQAVARHMKEHGQGGKIITISSGQAKSPSKANAHYSVSKLGMIGLSHVMALELAPYKINVNTILPIAVTLPADGQGEIFTDAVHEGLTKEEAMARAYPEEGLEQRVPLGRLGSPSETANLVAFLASGQSDYITGQVIACDGGTTLERKIPF